MKAMLSLALALALVPRPALPDNAGPIPWEGWSDGVFERAKRESRFVLLDLEAVWCHWCHVMDATTYRDPRVVELIRERFLPVKVDQDARPDLSNRYEDYGWPATVIFDAEGRELVKWAGYIPPPRMISLLEAVIEDPTPGPSVQPRGALVPAEGAALTSEQRKELEEVLVNRYDFENEGWGFVKKFLDWDSVEYCMAKARSGDARAERMARKTLEAQLQLLDPVWGGVYQYSHGGNWRNPHFEKIMQFQAENLRIYAQASAQWRDPAFLDAARSVHRYLRSFLRSPEGAFYVSQDADLVKGEHSEGYFALDDAGRRKLGVPKVDTNLYARETAWAVNALVHLYAVTGDESVLAEALRAAEWILANRALPGGGFRHATVDSAGPYLGDTAAAGRAFLALYAATADRAWLARAEEAAVFIGSRFRADGVPGFVTSVASSRLLAPQPQRDENVMVARFMNLLSRYTGKASHRALAEHAMRYLAIPTVALRFNTSSALLADLELGTEPLHVTVVGRRDDPAARALHLAALARPESYKRVELWDPRDGPLPNPDVTYPKLPRAAAFLCTQGRCSSPAYTPEELRAKVERLLALARAAASELP
jgi:uncharacterized protein YyaL (SSP411 family)